MKKDELFRDWAEKVVRVAIRNQDKTFRQLVKEELIDSWSSHVIKNSR